MQKKIIALAVAGLVSGAAFAQTNVTLYGVADIGYGYFSSSTKGTSNKFSGIRDGGDVGLQGSRLGFRGEEALGNGLKAVFTIEYGVGLNAGQGTGFTNNRQSFVGLSGGFGTVTMGRQYAPSNIYLGGTSSTGISSVAASNFLIGAGMHSRSLDIDLTGKGFSDPSGNPISGVHTFTAGGTLGFKTMQTGNGSRWDNSIAYDSPNWSGLQFRAIYGFGNNVRDSFGDASSDSSQFGLGVRYSNGPLYLTAIYQTVMGDDDAVSYTQGDGDNQAWAIGGAYDFKVVKVFANYIREKDDYNGIAVTNSTVLPDITVKADDITKTYWSLGLSAPVSAAGTVQVEYARIKTDLDETRSHGFTVGYVHALSKRTALYSYLTRMSNQDLVGSAVNRGAGVGINGESQTAFAMGINHKF